jgi:hypothetical protein
MKSILSALAFAICLSSHSPAFSRGVGKLVTKQTQEKLGLEFDLSAAADENSALVILKIPKSGKLKDVLEVRLSISAEDQKHFLVRAPLEMREKDGAVAVSAQLSPELAEKAAIELVMTKGRNEFFYHVRLSDYIVRAGAAANK